MLFIGELAHQVSALNSYPYSRDNCRQAVSFLFEIAIMELQFQMCTYDLPICMVLLDLVTYNIETLLKGNIPNSWGSSWKNTTNDVLNPIPTLDVNDAPIAIPSAKL